jgi:hypothetical protein
MLFFVKSETIEAEARQRSAELLWSRVYRDLPRGLAAILDADDEIGEVISEYVEVLKFRAISRVSAPRGMKLPRSRTLGISKAITNAPVGNLSPEPPQDMQESRLSTGLRKLAPLPARSRQQATGSPS